MYKITKLSTQRKGWSTQQTEECILCSSTYIISLWFDPSWDRTPDPVSAAVSLEKAIYLSPCLGAGCEFLALFIFSGSWQGSCITN